MRIHNIAPLVMAFSLLMPTSLQATPSPETEFLYQQHCASCHGQDRLGGMGPALLPDNLSRLKKPQAEDAIRNGRPATQMPAFADVLGKESITALADFIYQPPASPPTWGRAEILGSHLLPHPKGTLPDKPAYQADMMNLFLVVEIGDHHVTLLDGDRMEPIHRFPSRYALHG